jgi:hypothetical protein
MIDPAEPRADASPALRIKASEAMRGGTLTLRVRVVRDWPFRLGLGVMKLGGAIMGLGAVRIEREGDEPASR